MVCGEAGVGKTSLVTRLASEHRDVWLLWGGCEALHSPLGPLYDMAGSLAPGLQALIGPHGYGVTLFSALLRELQRSTQPTLLVFEDLHWADAATLDLVKYPARRIQHVLALMILTCRDDELPEQHPLRQLLGDRPMDAVIRVPLLALSEIGVADARAIGELSFWLRQLGIAHTEPLAVEEPYALLFSGRWQGAAEAWATLRCPYEQALALLDKLGASASAKRCRERLAEAGAPRGGTGPRATTAANPAGLTAREFQVLSLVALGLTNAQIASRLVRSEKTVDHHVAAIPCKLSVRSRGEAAVVANRLGLVA